MVTFLVDQNAQLQGLFGMYELTKQGLKSRHYVTVPAQEQEAQLLMDETSSYWEFQDCVKRSGFTATTTVDPVVKLEPRDIISPSSPALSFASTSSYGESRFLEPCYDHMYSWLDVVSSVEENFFCEMQADDPVLPPQTVIYDTIQKPSTPASQKENFLDEDILETKPEPVVTPYKSPRLLQ